MLEVICAIPISAETQKKPPGRSGTPSQLPEGLPDDQIVQAGTRHALLVHQATKARYDGLSEEECENFLTAWTAEQDPSLIESSPEKVAQDIRQLVRWMYGDTFRMRNKPQDEVVFTKQDTALVLGQPTRSLRRLLFLLIGLERSGHPGVSEKDLGLHIGISRCMMEKNLNRLEKEGRIHRIRNPCTRREDGTYYQRSNTYRVQGIPRIQKPDENTPEKHVILSMEMLLSSFDEVYFKTMADMMNKHGLENAALSGELEAYKDTWLYNQGPVTEHDIQRGARRRKL